MTTGWIGRGSLLGAALTLAAAGAPAEELVFEAFAPLIARGEQSVADEEGLTRLEGNLTGPLYADLPDGPPREEGLLFCRFALEIDTENLTEGGTGECELTRPGSADAISAVFECTGRMGEGCRGEFVVTGGEGAYEGASGGGTATLVARQRTFGIGEDNAVIETVYALAHWNSLRLVLPD